MRNRGDRDAEADSCGKRAGAAAGHGQTDEHGYGGKQIKDAGELLFAECGANHRHHHGNGEVGGGVVSMAVKDFERIGFLIDTDDFVQTDKIVGFESGDPDALGPAVDAQNTQDKIDNRPGGDKAF